MYALRSLIRSPYAAFGLFLLGAILWVGFAWGVAPSMIRAAYDGSGFAFIRAQMVEGTDEPLAYYLGKWHAMAWMALGAWTLLFVLVSAMTSRAFERRVIGTARPDTLAAIRILVCLIAAYWAYTDYVTQVAAWPNAERHTMGVMDLFYALPGFEVLTTTPWAAWCFQLLTVGVLLAGAVGWKTRWVLPLGAVLYLVLIGIVRSYTWFNHTGLVPFYVLAVLSFTRCGMAWSVDDFLRRRRGEAVSYAPEARYAWGRFAVWLVIAVPYVAAGLSKLRNGGLSWWDSTNMQAIVYNQLLDPEGMHLELVSFFTALPAWTFGVMGLLTLVTEIGMGAVLFSRWARRIMPTLTIGMHVGIALVMGIAFWDLVLLQAVFFNWRPLMRRIQPWIERLGVDYLNASAQASSQGPKADYIHIEHERTTPAGQAPPSWRCGLSLAGLTVVFVLAWGWQLELYPITAMQMFSGYEGSGIIVRTEPRQTTVSGEASVAPLRAMGVPGRGYTRFLESGFDSSDDRAYLRRVLRERGQAWNQEVPPDEQVRRLEVVLYEWDYVNDRNDPDFGTPIDRISVELSPSDRPASQSATPSQ